MTKRMRAHKVEDPSVMNLVDTMHASQVPHPNVMRVLRSVAGGVENLHLTERDVQNRRAAHVREERMDDIPKLLAFFRECKANNPQFFYEFQLDDKNVVKNVFWSHASQQGDYADYSSVVTFDTTYRTNQYSMPLAMFVGFNNKLQNVVFGQALLRDERADTFEWLFKQFRACMGGKDPIVIFTDQDSSIEKAINLVFQKTYHRYCRWHVTNKPIEFEQAWAPILDKYEVHESKVLMKLYDERNMWVGAYFKEIFCGTMTSTQRSESVNSTVKHGYCDNSTAIHEFAKSFLELLAHNKEKEAEEEFNSQAPVIASTFYGYDNQLSRVYTRAVYKVFASRLKSSTAFRVRPDPDKAGYYLVKHTRPPTDFPWLCHEFWVKAVVNEEIPEESEFNCECMRIEHTDM
ncbi:protein FAR1-RELATED SEQUENCE 5-like [Panicum virgatum]|uniref:protein FAR1-RELATED SEQUENCE 5-like n=1 Tax=Panicum virgatum TaxID=38727 RepID=UPI0019D516D3|nr:protein FAR1-RELATED SEQUENCE 5-like [Panicum virgatum]